MNPRVKSVRAMQDYKLQLTFTNGEKRIFDARPYLSKGVFQELMNETLFKTVRVSLGSIQWRNGQDLCPDCLYLESKPLQPSIVRKRATTKNPVGRLKEHAQTGRQ